MFVANSIRNTGLTSTMKYRHSKDQQQVRRLVEAQSRLNLEDMYPYAQLRKAIRQVDAETAWSRIFIIKHLIEQREDLYDILIGEHTVLTVELARSVIDSEPLRLESYSVDDYRQKIKNATQHYKKSLELALGLLKDE